MEGGSVLEATGASPAAFKATAARIERLELVLDELRRVERRARREGDAATLDLLQLATPAAARRLDDLKLRGEHIEQSMGFDAHFVHSTPVTASHKQFRMLLKLLGPSKPQRRGGGRARSRSSGSSDNSGASDSTGSSSSSERRGGRRRRRGRRRRGGRSRRRRRRSSSGSVGSPTAVPYYQYPQQHPYAQGPPLAPAYAYPPPLPQATERSHGRRRRRRSEPPPHPYPHPHVGAPLPPGAYYPYAQQAPAGHVVPPPVVAQQPAHADPSLYAAGAGFAAHPQQPVHFSPVAAPAAAAAASLASVSPAPSGRLAPPAADVLARPDAAHAAQEAAEAAAAAAAAAPVAAAAAAPDIVADFSASVSARPPQDGEQGVPGQVVETTENAACEYVSKLSHEAALRCVHSLLQHVRETGSGGGSSLDDYLIAGGDSDRKWRDRRRVLQTVVTMPQTCQQLLGSTQLASVPLGLKGWACLEVLRFYNGGTGLAHPYDGRFKAVLCSPSPANKAALEAGVRGRVAALGLDGPSAELLHIVLDHLHDACYTSAPSPAQTAQHRQLCTLFARALAPHLLSEQDVHEPAQALAASPDVSGLAAALHTLSCERTPLGFVFQHRDDTSGGGDGEADADRRSSIRSTGGAAALGRRSARGGFGGGRGGGGGARSSRIIGALSSVAASVGDDFGGDFGGGGDLMTGFGGSVSVRPFGASRTTPRTARGSVAVSAPASQSGDVHHHTPDSKPSKAPRDIDSEFDHY